MPKRNRLSRRAPGVIGAPRKKHGTLFSLSVHASASATARGSVAVSKKVSPKAAKRNLIKRRARAILAPHLKQMRPGAYVLSAKAAAAQASYAQMRSDIDSLMAQ